MGYGASTTPGGLLQLVAIIGQGLDYDSETVWLAAHLHDWGAYAPFALKGVDHVLRSRQVAELFLADRDLPAGDAKPGSWNVLRCTT